MSWNYRIAHDGDRFFLIEAHYDDNGLMWAWSEAAAPQGETLNEMHEDQGMQTAASGRPLIRKVELDNPPGVGPEIDVVDEGTVYALKWNEVGDGVGHLSEFVDVYNPLWEGDPSDQPLAESTNLGEVVEMQAEMQRLFPKQLYFITTR